MSNRPTEQEYAPYYADYVDRAPEEDVAAALEAQSHYTLEILNAFDNEQASIMHGTTKWTLKETLGHLCDAERVFLYRAMRIARGDKTPLPGLSRTITWLAGISTSAIGTTKSRNIRALRRRRSPLPVGPRPEHLRGWGLPVKSQ